MRRRAIANEARYSATIEIRPAVFEDAEGIASAFLESADYHAELDSERYVIPAVESIVSHYRQKLRHPSHGSGEEMILVADIGGNVVGFIDARLEASPDAMHREMSCCHISEIAVLRAYRNRGIEGHLLQTAHDWGRQQGAKFASLEYHPDNKLAETFYQKRMGYRSASITAIKRL